MAIIPAHQLNASKISEVLGNAFFEISEIEDHDNREFIIVDGGGLAILQVILIFKESKFIKIIIDLRPPKKSISYEQACILANHINDDGAGQFIVTAKEDGGFSIQRSLFGERGIDPFYIVDGVRTLDSSFNAIYSHYLNEYYN